MNITHYNILEGYVHNRLLQYLYSIIFKYFKRFFITYSTVLPAAVSQNPFFFQSWLTFSLQFPLRLTPLHKEMVSMIFSFVTSSLDYFNSHKQRQQAACMDKHTTPAKTEAQKGSMQEVEARLRWPRRNLGLAGMESEKPKQPRAKFDAGMWKVRRDSTWTAKGRQRKMCTCWNGYSPWSQRIWEGLRYLMSSFALVRHINISLQESEVPATRDKCGAMKTFSVDNDGVKEHLRWAHTGTWDKTGCNKECWVSWLMSLQGHSQNCI